MYRFPKAYSRLAIIASIGIGLVGCTTEHVAENEASPTSATPSQAAPTNTVAVANSHAVQSPASTAFQVPTKETSARQVCRQFIERLNQGDYENVELLLSPAALTVTNRMRFRLPPLAAPDARVVIAEPEFNTIREKISYVRCTIEDSTDIGSNDEGVANHSISQLAIMLRMTSQGWRVSGMVIDDDQTGAPNLLSFENATDVGVIQSTLQIKVAHNDAIASDVIR